MPLPLRPNVCLLIFDRNKRLFLGERAKEAGHWQFPQGGVEDDADLAENALREAEEELGADRELFGNPIQLNCTFEYEWDEAPAHFKGQFRGQAQTFWAMEFLGQDSDIELDRHHQEFQNFCWCKVDEVLDKAADKRQAAYQECLVEFKKL